MGPQSEPPLIMQFGTSRFLQAHVDLFVGQSLAAERSSAPIAVIQTSSNPQGKDRVRAMNASASYPVRIQGLKDSQLVDEDLSIASIECAIVADSDWDQVVDLFCTRASHVVSNTGDDGYRLHDEDHLGARPPSSFPAKLLALLFERYKVGGSGVSIMPCELIANNGRVLKKIVLDLAAAWELPDDFVRWLETECLWVNSLVDRIVSQAIDPVGAVAEPYALWAIEAQPGLVLPCQHEAIRIVDDLASIEWLKLGILNLSHSYLVDLWLQEQPADIVTVCQAMHDTRLRGALDELLAGEVIPILKTMALDEDVDAYAETVLERFLNPFLEHRLADIAQNHETKIRRRLLPIWQRRPTGLPDHTWPRLRACLSRHQLVSEAEV